MPARNRRPTGKARTMSHSKDKDTKKMTKKEPQKTPKEKKEAKRLKKFERQHG